MLSNEHLKIFLLNVSFKSKCFFKINDQLPKNVEFASLGLCGCYFVTSRILLK